MPQRRKGRKKGRDLRGMFRGDVHVLALWLIILLAAVLAYAFYTGPYLQFDDATYLSLLGQVGAHTFTTVLNPRAFSFLFIYLSYLGQATFGAVKSSVIIFSMVEYLSLIFLTYLLAVRVSKDKKLALLAAFLVCIFPFTVQYSSRLLPDMLMGVLATLSLVFLMSSRRTDWILAGAMAGFLVYAKLMGLAFIIPFFICALASRKRSYVIPALLITLAVFTIPFIAYVHDPLYAFQNYGSFQELLSPTTPANNLVGLMLMGSLLQEYQSSSINFQNYQLGIILWLAALGTVLAIKYIDKRMAAMAGLFWIYLLYLCFGTISLSGYEVGAFITRYLIVVAAPLAILVAYAVKNIVVRFPVRGRGNWVHIALFLLLIAGIIISMWHSYQLVYYYNEMIRLNPLWVPPGAHPLSS